MFCRHLPGLARAAAEIEFREGLLQRPRPDMRARKGVESALKMLWTAAGPQRLQNRDLLLHECIALFLGVADAFGLDLALVLAGDEIDADAPARHPVER